MRELAKNWNLKCYCGKPTQLYDGLFERNFCSAECAENLKIFFGSIEESQQIVQKAKIHGDFKIQGSVVTLFNDAQRVGGIIDRIDKTVQKQVEAQTKEEKTRKDLKKLGLDDATIAAMLQAKG